MRNMIKIALLLIIFFLITLLMPFFSPALSTLIGIAINMFIAAGLAYVSYPIVKFLKGKGVHNALASAITLLLFLFIFVVAATLIVQLIYPQIIRAIELIANSSSNISWIRDNPQIQEAYNYISPYFDRFSQTALDYIANTTQSFIAKSSKFITDAVLIISLYLYIVFDNERIIRSIKKKLVYGSKNYEFVKRLDQEFMKYLRGLIIIICITIVEYGIVYYFIGHPDWMALAALCAFSNLIPYFGGIIVNLIALATAIFYNFKLFIKVLVCVIVLPTIEGNVINPMVHKKTIKISPIVLLPSIFIGSAIFGFLGIVLSIPAIIFFKVFKEYYSDDVKQFFRRLWNS
ncbi:AI-2E family transporter [Erysipelotrichaceae bacterium OttesenSCG-928-M19]|nr:AI-2E family transporter [Erysipelotrichaceae bacterium OttesenSCG-928-M19]